MSKYIASSAIRGAHELIHRVGTRLQEAIAQHGPETKVEFTNTAYYLPIILGMTGVEVKTLGDMVPALDYCRDLLQPVPSGGLWMPYLGTTLDAGMATLMAEEILMGIGFVEGTQPEPFGWEGDYVSPAGKGDKRLNGPIDDIQLRAWGIQLVDGRMPGFAAVLGCAKSNEVAVQIVRELQRRNILVFLSGNVNGRSVVQQLMEEGVELGYDTYTVPFGTNTESTSYALGFATRSALTFGGLKGGQAKEILEYNEHRTFAFAVGLGPIDDLKYATAAGAVNYGFPAIADTRIPNIFPSGLTLYEAVVSVPFDEIEGRDDIERAERLVQRCIEVRGVKIKITEVPIPVPYGSAFEGERVRKEDMRVEFGGKKSRAFEYLRMLPLDEVEDHKIELIGPGLESVPEGEAMDLGIIVEVAGRKMQEDFEPVLERQIHYFTNGASGVQHIGQRDIAWIRINKAAAAKGFELKHFGEILYARMHADFGAILDKVQVKIITDPQEHALWLEKARAAYDVRNRRLGEMTDESVDTFYSCTLCQSFAPNHVCIISPERLGLCGAYNWLDCKASREINPTGPNQPVLKGACSDSEKGYWDNIDKFVQEKSHGMVEKVSLYSIMEYPMTSCFTADAEVIVDGQPVRIGDLVDEQINNRWYYSSAFTLKDGGQAGYDRIVGMHQNPAPETLFRVATKSGNEMVLTGNHAIAVDRPEGLTWVRADQLRVGERVYALSHLDLPASLPDVVDLLPDTFRVPATSGSAELTVEASAESDDAALLDDLKGRLKARYGSLAAAYRETGISPLDPRTPSIPIGTLKRLVAALGEDWSQVKKTISKVTLGGGSTYVLPKLDGDLFYLMGLLASGGSLSRRGKHECFINFVNADQGLLAAFEETYTRVFPNRNLGLAKKEIAESVLHGRKIQPTQECFSYYGANPLLGALCDAFGIKMADEKRWDLGRMISLPEEAIAAFIAGCFDGDGSVRLRQHDGRWEIGEAYLCIDDERAAHHLQLLLKRLDIVGNIHQSGAVFKIELHGSNLRRFAEVIPARHPAKKQTLQEIAALPRESLDKTQAEVLPYAVGKALASLAASQEVLSPSTLYYYETARSRPVRDNVQKVVDAWPETAPLLEPFLDSDTFLDIVAEVEPIENRGQYSHVYNLTLMDFHNYFANQTLVKNCGCFECIMMIVPEANGFMTVSREDPSMTPAGMTFSTLAGTAGGGLQSPGVMGHGKFFITSKKFIKADGGLKRMVWMSSFLKESMAEELKAAAIREGDPDLIDKIADERVATTVEELLAYIEEKGHPALTMPPLF